MIPNNANYIEVYINNSLNVLLPDIIPNDADIQVLTRPKTYPVVTNVTFTTYNAAAVDIMLHLDSKYQTLILTPNICNESNFVAPVQSNMCIIVAKDTITNLLCPDVVIPPMTPEVRQAPDIDNHACGEKHHSVGNRDAFLKLLLSLLLFLDMPQL